MCGFAFARHRAVPAGDALIGEQRLLFPAALAELDPAEWDTVDAVRARVGNGLPRVVVG